jgi:hypothetical protein
MLPARAACRHAVAERGGSRSLDACKLASRRAADNAHSTSQYAITQKYRQQPSHRRVEASRVETQHAVPGPRFFLIAGCLTHPTLLAETQVVGLWSPSPCSATAHRSGCRAWPARCACNLTAAGTLDSSHPHQPDLTCGRTVHVNGGAGQGIRQRAIRN